MENPAVGFKLVATDAMEFRPLESRAQAWIGAMMQSPVVPATLGGLRWRRASMIDSPVLKDGI